MPIGTATRTENTMVARASARVGSMRCAIRSATGRLENIDLPKSPTSTLELQRKNCS